MWAPIIARLIEVFGPLVAEWLKKWIESLLNKAAAGMDEPAAFGTEHNQRVALLDAAIGLTHRPVRRALLRQMRRVTVRDGILTGADLDEFRDVARAAAED